MSIIALHQSLINPSSVSSVSLSLPANAVIPVGNACIVFTRYNAASTTTISVSDGASSFISSFIFRSVYGGGLNTYAQFFYSKSVASSGGQLFTVTLGAAETNLGFYLWNCSPGDLASSPSNVQGPRGDTVFQYTVAGVNTQIDIAGYLPGGLF